MKKKTLTDEQIKLNGLTSRRKWVIKNRDKVREYNKNWIKNNPEKRKQYAKSWDLKNPNRRNELAKLWRINNQEKKSNYNKKYRNKNKEVIAKRLKRYRDELKMRAYNHYSNYNIQCNCCREKHIEFLSLDHVNNDGASMIKIQQHGMSFYTWLKKNNYPSGFQILCMNCNFAKGLDKEHICIHQKEKVSEILK